MNNKFFKKRVWALGIDCIISLSVVSFILIIVSLASKGIISDWLTSHKLAGLALYIPFATMVLLKDVRGRSVGKRCLGLTIVDAEKKQQISVRRLIIRNIPMLLALAVDIGYLYQTETRLGDIIAKTEVIEIKNNPE